MVPEYSFPAIRGMQAGHEYYVSMLPIRLIPKLFSFDDEEVPPEMRAQRTLNQARVPEIARYILNNPKSYVFSAITASIKARVRFAPLGTDEEGEDIGILSIPFDARFVINDGQHRRAAFEMALKENPDLGDETIAVVLFIDIGLKRSQQMFTDLNRHAAHPDPSLNILYDGRDKKAVLTKEVMKRVRVFKVLTDTEKSSLSKRSSKLFTLSGLYFANQALLCHHKTAELEQQVEVASGFWRAVSSHIPDWDLVLQKKVSASEIRRDYVHSHAVTLQGIGGMGAELMATYPDTWTALLAKLRDIDWSRSNPLWEGRIMTGGHITKSRTSVAALTAYLKSHLGLSLTPEEERLERNHKVNDGVNDE